ncbi:MAG: hypothetical protein JSS66_00700 [Armatimonadetes bacterium]|nr:hypothetical protein [Armatimonadota bacterium]
MPPTSDEEIGLLVQDAVMEHDPGEAFDQSVVREAILEYHSRTLRFWMPAILGAMVGGVALLAALELLLLSPARVKPNVRGQEAKVERQVPTIPDFTDPGAGLSRK